MPAALALHIRREIVTRREAGESFAQIARQLQVSYDAVRQIYRRHAQTGRLTPAYERCVHTEVRHAEAIYQAAVKLKREHPRWGAGLIWVELAEHYEEASLPSIRTLQRWFRRAQVQSRGRDHSPKGQVTRGKAVHEVWALDAKEQIALADGSSVSWLTITDEASGAILNVHLFPREALDKPRSVAGQGGAASQPESMGVSATVANG